MKVSRRVRRMERHHKKAKQPALNLVSLMDIFTILVFFLLVNSSSSEQIPNKKELVLPYSTAQAAPKENLKITITKTDVLIQGRSMGRIDELLLDPTESIPRLKEELEFEASKIRVSEETLDKGRSVTIIADENTAFELVKKILTTCQAVNYTNISFAATQKAKKKS